MQPHLMLVLLACGFLGATAQALNAGNCPKPEPIAPFNISQLQGVWYTIQRTDPLWSEFGSSCVQANISATDDTSVHIKWKAKAWVAANMRTWTDVLEISEYNPSHLLKEGKTKYIIVETDAAEYLVLYSCNQFVPNFFYGDEVRMLARDQTMSRDTVMNIQRKLKNKGLRPQTLTYVNQADC